VIVRWLALFLVACGDTMTAGTADAELVADSAVADEATSPDDGEADAVGDVLPDAEPEDVAPIDTALEEEEVVSLPEGLHHLRGGASDEWSNEDLAPFAALVGDAPLVGLGESVHTSGGFYAAKRRLIRFLVDELGFRAVAMETPRTAAELTARYVERCDITSRQALYGIFGVFANANTQYLLEDLCDHNRAHPDDPVRFYGFDMQQPEDDYALLEAFLGEVAPVEGEALLAPIADWCHLDQFAPVTAGDYDACIAALDEVDALFEARTPEWNATLGEDVIAIARLALVSLRAWETEFVTLQCDLVTSYQARDSAMAEVFITLRRWRYAEKTVIWAHDFHLMAMSRESTMEPVIDGLGAQLAREYGEDYRPFAISAQRLGVNWPGVGCGDIDLIQPDSLEERLAAFGAIDVLVDPVAASSGEDPWLLPNALIPYGINGSSDLARQFRGVFVLAESPGMDAVLWPQCTARGR
jgi:erythromycin esterase